MIIRSTLRTAFTLIMYSRLSTIISEMVILGDDPFFILGRINRFVVVGQLVARSLHGRVYKSRPRQKVVQINRQSLDNRSLEIILKTDVSCHAKYSPLKSSLLIFVLSFCAEHILGLIFKVLLTIGLPIQMSDIFSKGRTTIASVAYGHMHRYLS